MGGRTSNLSRLVESSRGILYVAGRTLDEGACFVELFSSVFGVDSEDVGVVRRLPPRLQFRALTTLRVVAN
jgi:hypothetical protein